MRFLYDKRDRDSRAVFSKQYMQARLLQAVAGLAIGSRDLYLESEMTRSILVAAARRANLLRSLKTHEGTPPNEFSHITLAREAGPKPNDEQTETRRGQTEETEEELEIRWYRWLEEEEKRRLGWGIYVSLEKSERQVAKAHITD